MYIPLDPTGVIIQKIDTCIGQWFHPPSVALSFRHSSKSVLWLMGAPLGLDQLIQLTYSLKWITELSLMQSGCDSQG